MTPKIAKVKEEPIVSNIVGKMSVTSRLNPKLATTATEIALPLQTATDTTTVPTQRYYRMGWVRTMIMMDGGTYIPQGTCLRGRVHRCRMGTLF